MQIENPFQMNDWGVNKFFHVILAIQLAMWGVIGLDSIGLSIPIVRQLIGFIYLTFIPGMIILRILKLHKLSNIETLLYSVGLSIALLMSIGFLINTVYPPFGISKPISLMPLMITISIVVLILCVLCYMRDQDFYDPSFIEIKDVLSPPVLFLSIIPFMAIFGTYLVNFHQNNVILIFMILIVGLIVLLIGFDKFIPPKLYPLAVAVISISLLFHKALISMYIWGWDINVEYYTSNLVISNSLWDSTIDSALNAMLSIVMLAPILSTITDLSLDWIFKIAYPLLFSIVPLGLYKVFQKQTDDKIAFMSVFFLMSIFTFYTEMLTLARQEIAELFLVLILLLLIDKDLDKMKRLLLLIIFTFSLGVSHYGLSYIFLALLIIVWALRYFYEQYSDKRIIYNFTTTFVLLVIAFVLSWYMYISSSSTFSTIVRIADQITSSFFTDFLNPNSAEGIRILKMNTTLLHNVAKYLHIVAQIFISFGVVSFLLNPNKTKFDREYAAFSVLNYIMLVGAIAIPFFASSLATTRLYHISVLFLSPFFVIGALTMFNVVDNTVKVCWLRKSSFEILSLFLVIFFLFNSGLIYEVTNDDNPTSISLNNTIDSPLFNEKEVLGAKWINDVESKGTIYADFYRWLLIGRFDWENVKSFQLNVNYTPHNSYIFLGSTNIDKEEVIIVNHMGARKSQIEYVNSIILINGRDKIYDNAGAQVFY